MKKKKDPFKYKSLITILLFYSKFIRYFKLIQNETLALYVLFISKSYLMTNMNYDLFFFVCLKAYHSSTHFVYCLPGYPRLSIFHRVSDLVYLILNVFCSFIYMPAKWYCAVFTFKAFVFVGFFR